MLLENESEVLQVPRATLLRRAVFGLTSLTVNSQPAPAQIPQHFLWPEYFYHRKDQANGLKLAGHILVRVRLDT